MRAQRLAGAGRRITATFVRTARSGLDSISIVDDKQVKYLRGPGAHGRYRAALREVGTTDIGGSPTATVIATPLNLVPAAGWNPIDSRDLRARWHRQDLTEPVVGGVCTAMQITLRPSVLVHSCSSGEK